MLEGKRSLHGVARDCWLQHKLQEHHVPLRAKLKYQNFSKNFPKNLKNFRKSFLKFFWSIDRRRHRKQCRDDDDAKKTQKMVQKRSKTIRKPSKATWKSLENDPKIVRFWWAHCFELFWNFRIHMEFDTLILHLSVGIDIRSHGTHNLVDVVALIRHPALDLEIPSLLYDKKFSLRQKIFVTTKKFWLRQKIFVTTKKFRYDKKFFVTTKIFRYDKKVFVITKMFCRNEIFLP